MEKHPPVSPRCLGGRKDKCDFLTSPAWGWNGCVEPLLLVAAAPVLTMAWVGSWGRKVTSSWAMLSE